MPPELLIELLILPRLPVIVMLPPLPLTPLAVIVPPAGTLMVPETRVMLPPMPLAFTLIAPAPATFKVANWLKSRTVTEPPSRLVLPAFKEP